jgi:hypothetical protein
MGTHDQPTLARYTQPATMTSAGRYTPFLDSLPHDIPALAGVVQGLMIHEHMAHGYGVTLSDADRASVLLAEIVERDSRPLEVAREPKDRLAGNCRHFTVLMTAMLRAHGTPARARCGFGGYFGTDMFEDHWVCEYWHTGQRRWILVDAQVDDKQRGWFGIDFDTSDVPRDRFVVAGQHPMPPSPNCGCSATTTACASRQRSVTPPATAKSPLPDQMNGSFSWS